MEGSKNSKGSREAKVSVGELLLVEDLEVWERTDLLERPAILTIIETIADANIEQIMFNAYTIVESLFPDRIHRTTHKH